MKSAKIFLIILSVIALNNCAKTEYVVVNSCPTIAPSNWQTTAELYQEFVKYKAAYNNCIGNERIKNYE